MSDLKRVKRLLREFVSEVVVAGEFNDGEIRPVGNYRPDGNYRRTDNYRPDDPKAYLGMTQPVKEPQGDEEIDDLEGDEGAADGGQPKLGDQKNEPFNSLDTDAEQKPGTEPNAQEPAAKKPEWKNPLL